MAPAERLSDSTARLILHVYALGQNTREIAAVMGVEHDLVADAIARGCHLHALEAAGITEDEWRAEHGVR